MSLTVVLGANTLSYPEGGGHLWVYLNWALGLRALGCRVVWLEGVEPSLEEAKVRQFLAALRERLDRYGFGDEVVLASRREAPLSYGTLPGCLDVEDVTGADLFLNLLYDMPRALVRRFRRSALIDIDPGLLQIWVKQGYLSITPHDVHFSIGETVGRPNSRVPDVGIDWQYTPPAVSLDAWPVHPPAPDAAFTTISHWYAHEWIEWGGEVYQNDKRTGFLPYLDLPRHTPHPLELALCLAQEDEWAMLREKGWRVRHAWEVSTTPWGYQEYIQRSLGELSCVKPSCVRLQNAWISDRSLCFLASGKPVIVEHTGPSRVLPDDDGLLRFRTMAEAVRCLDAVRTDYHRHARSARALAEEYFDARKVVGRVLERAVD